MVRPITELDLKSIIHANGPFTDEIFKLDFENSLRASFTTREITQQLETVGLNLQVREFNVRDFADPKDKPHNLRVVVIHGAL
jgi:hypothetical protein